MNSHDSETHPATAGVRVRAFVEAVGRADQIALYELDERAGRTVLALAPVRTGGLAPLYLEDLMALIEDHRGTQDDTVIDDAYFHQFRPPMKLSLTDEAYLFMKEQES